MAESTLSDQIDMATTFYCLMAAGLKSVPTRESQGCTFQCQDARAARGTHRTWPTIPNAFGEFIKVRQLPGISGEIDRAVWSMFGIPRKPSVQRPLNSAESLRMAGTWLATGASDISQEVRVGRRIQQIRRGVCNPQVRRDPSSECGTPATSDSGEQWSFSIDLTQISTLLYFVGKAVTSSPVTFRASTAWLSVFGLSTRITGSR